MINAPEGESNHFTLVDLMPYEAIDLNLVANNRQQAIETLLERLDKSGAVIDPRQAIQDLLKREALGSTAMGRGVALPHAKTLGARQPALAFGRLEGGGMDFESLDGKPVHLVFLFIAPRFNAGLHLKVISALTRFLRSENNRNRLLQAPEDAAVRQLLKQISLD